MTKNIKRNIDGYVIHETFDPEGKIATQILQTSFGEKWLLQYDASGHVLFSQKMDNFSEKDITYYNGRVATIKQRNVITQYDDKCNITCQITVDKDDIINFNNGYLQSVTKNTGNTIQEIEFGEQGRKISSTQKVRKWVKNQMFWLTTEAKQYYPNGKIQSVVTYEQKTAWTSNFDVITGGGFSSNLYDEEKAMSYISSITQYDEKGKIVINAQLKEYDEINFNGEKVACITRRVKKSDGNLETMSQTTYYPSGNICTITNYKDGKVVSSVTYDETGKPQSCAQQGTEDYQDIYKDKKHNQKTAFVAKDTMPPQQAANVLGVSLNASEKEVKEAYRKLCKRWHPDINRGNEEMAKHKMQQINEAYNVMLQYIKTRSLQRPITQPQNRPEQTSQPQQQPGDRPAVFRAWIKLQEAIRNYDQAVERLKYATQEKERIASEYARTPANDPKKQKLAQQLRKAQANWSCCVNNKLRAQAYKDQCEREYNRLRVQNYTKLYQQNYYQRAA